MLTPENRDQLESLIDTSSLAEVINCLSEICGEKADHIESAWQDKKTAKPWKKAMRKLEKIGSETEI